MRKSFYKRVCSFGPGGIKCPCCFPSGGTKARKAAKREMQKTSRSMFTKLLSESLAD